VRVLLVNWQDRENPQAGGAEIHLHEIFGRLASSGFEVTLLCSGWRGARPRAALDGIDVHRTGSRHTFSAAAPRYARRAFSARQFDVVVEALNKVPVFSPLWAGAPVVLLVHHLFGTTAFREAPLPIAALTWLLERPIPLVYRGVDVQAISESTADDLVARGVLRDRVRVIHPGVDVGFFHPDPAVPRTDVPTFLYLGRLRRYKGIETALRAVAELARGGTHIRLWIAGKGEWEPRLRALCRTLGVRDRVEFVGYVDEERKRELFRRAWANLYPSPKEGWGITNLEAAACGTPTVASDSPGLRESVVDGSTGLLVPHGDSTGLAEALAGLAASPARVGTMGSAARLFAEGFTWDEAARRPAEHLRDAVGHGP
jgi:glycosyltransferase involved in cell wall biosynthesis